jgi:hypothetical protein
MDDLTLEEKVKIREGLKEPHFSYIESKLLNRTKVAFSILQRKEADILLVDSYGFSIDSVFAGLSEKNIEYIAKNGPKNYKNNILKILGDQGMLKGVFEIAQAMDEDMNGDTTRNQERVRNVIQYIEDNKIAFQF